MGSGAHGHVFALIDDPTKVIKIAWAPTITQYSLIPNQEGQWTFDRVRQTYQHLLHHQISVLAALHQFDLLLRDDVKQYYAVVMEKLVPLSEDENKVFKSIVMEYNGGIALGAAMKHLEELHEWLDFDKEKVVGFYREVNALPMVHRDFHRRNIMKDGSGNFKMVDFELLVIKDSQSKDN